MDELRRLNRLLARPEHEIGLAEGALLLARCDYPQLDVAAYLQRLDHLADAVRRRLPDAATLTDKIFALNGQLFEAEGFRGDDDDYFDPRNSFLNEVLDRKRGLPITLSIVYIEVGRRLGLPLEGVSFPGHFLVKLPVHGGGIVLDPYFAGESLSEEELRARLEAASGSESPRALNEALEAASKQQILLRVLRNLKHLYYQRAQYDKALQVTDRILCLVPDISGEVRDRAQILEKLECFHSALQNYYRYLELSPDALDAFQIRERIVGLQAVQRRLQ